jgi:predicted anti-sigma-YlaC factor YlaD
VSFGKTIIRVLTLSCSETARLLSASRDHDLPRAERLAMRLHLIICKACRRYERQLALIEEAIRRCQEPVATTLTPEARERLKRTLRDP